MTATNKARLEFEHEGQVARVILCSPKGNIIDQAMMGDLELIFEELATRSGSEGRCPDRRRSHI